MASPFDNLTYKKARSCPLMDGGHAAAAIRRSDDAVCFARSWDGITWNEPIVIAAIEIGSKAIDLYEESMSGSSRLVVTNGSGFHYNSESTGASWSAF